MEGRCSLLAWFLVIIAVASAQNAQPVNAKSSPELSRALLLLQRLLLALTFEDVSLQHGAFMASFASSGTTSKPSSSAVIYEEGDYYYDDEYAAQAELPKAAACVEAECPSFNCSSDDVEVAKIVKAFPPMSSSDIRTACGKKYIFSSTELTYDDAGLACCKQNMSLVSIESGEEYSCLIGLYQNELQKGSTFWSSGMYMQCPYSYRWCASMQTFKGEAAWKKGELDAPGECVAVRYTADNAAMTFVDSPCTNKQKFICETDTADELILRNMELKKLEKVNCKKPNCPLFDCQADPKAPNVTVDVVCGKRYTLRTDRKLNFVRAEMACCELGMRLVSVESRDEQLCLEKAYSNRLPNNVQLWTSGTDLGCEGRYGWCGSGASIKAVDSLVWMDGEPNNFLTNEDCLVMWNYNGQFKLNDEVCVQEYAYICEEYSNATVVDSGPDLVTIRTTRAVPTTTASWLPID